MTDTLTTLRAALEELDYVDSENASEDASRKVRSAMNMLYVLIAAMEAQEPVANEFEVVKHVLVYFNGVTNYRLTPSDDYVTLPSAQATLRKALAAHAHPVEQAIRSK